MRIGYSCTTIAPYNIRDHKIDGVGYYTKFLYEALQAEGKHILPFYFATPKRIRRYKDASIKEQPLAILSAVLPPFIALHADIEKQIDIFHSTDYLIPRLKKTPVIATLHDPIMLKEPGLANQRLRSLKNKLLKRSAKWADHVITVSQTMVADIINYWGVEEEKISVVYNGVDSSWFKKKSTQQKRMTLDKYQLQKEFLLFVGTLQPRKNIGRIIAAYQLLPKALRKQHPLVLVGRQGWSTQGIMPIIEKFQASGEGKWLQYVPFDDLQTLYQCAYTFVFPSLSEGFGLPVIEAFASEIPVITSNTTCLPEIAGDAACLVDPYSVEQLSAAMQVLLTDVDVRHDYIQRGKQRARNFSWQTCAYETYKIYERFI